jgi:hypothetical protein
MDGKSDCDTGSLQQLHKFVKLLLRLSDRKTVTRHNDHTLGVAHEDTGIRRLGRLQTAFDRALLVLGFIAKI